MIDPRQRWCGPLRQLLCSEERRLPLLSSYTHDPVASRTFNVGLY